MYLHSFRLRRIATNGSHESTNLNATLKNITGDSVGSYDNNLNAAYTIGTFPWTSNPSTRIMAAIFDSNGSYSGNPVGNSEGEEVIQAGTTRIYALSAIPGGTVDRNDSIAVNMPQDRCNGFLKGSIEINYASPSDILTINGVPCDWIWSDNYSGPTHSPDWSSGETSDDWYNGFFEKTEILSIYR